MNLNSLLLPAQRKKRALFLAIGLVLGVSTAALSQPRQYVIDPKHFSVGFLVFHIGYAKVLGMFREASGSFTFDEGARKISNLRIVIKADSVFTNDKRRDDHLRSADFLNSVRFPEIVFAAGKAVLDERGKGQLQGNLTILGKTKPLTLDVKWNKSAESPISSGLFKGKPYVTGVSVRGMLKRSEFGMTYGLANGWVGDEVELIIEFEAQRQ